MSEYLIGDAAQNRAARRGRRNKDDVDPQQIDWLAICATIATKIMGLTRKDAAWIDASGRQAFVVARDLTHRPIDHSISARNPTGYKLPKGQEPFRPDVSYTQCQLCLDAAVALGLCRWRWTYPGRGVGIELYRVEIIPGDDKRMKVLVSASDDFTPVAGTRCAAWALSELVTP